MCVMPVHAVLPPVRRWTGPRLELKRSGLSARSVCIAQEGVFHANVIASEFRANLCKAVLLELWQCDFSPVSAALFLAKLLATPLLAANTAFWIVAWEIYFPALIRMKAHLSGAIAFMFSSAATLNGSYFLFFYHSHLLLLVLSLSCAFSLTFSGWGNPIFESVLFFSLIASAREAGGCVYIRTEEKMCTWDTWVGAVITTPLLFSISAIQTSLDSRSHSITLCVCVHVCVCRAILKCHSSQS